ncbi:MAG TPA: hypothetical protein VFB25_01995 [Gaiellaceae bacterium]|nr:hypothetical protein [Gaiellaceae bacterium]
MKLDRSLLYNQKLAISVAGVIGVGAGIVIIIVEPRAAGFAAFLIAFGIAPVPRYFWRKYQARRHARGR